MQAVTADVQALPIQPPVKAVPGFALLFSVSLPAVPSAVDLDAALHLGGVTSFSAQQRLNYRHLRDETEVHVLGRAFMDAGRLTHSAIGRIALTRSASDPHGPSVADVHLFTHVAGVALWEVWLPGQLQDFNAERWTAWLDDQLPGSLPIQVWQALQPLNLALGGESAYRQYLPCSVVRLPTQPLAALTAGQAADIVRLLWRDRSARRLKPDVVDAELARDFCARVGGITLLGRLRQVLGFEEVFDLNQKLPVIQDWANELARHGMANFLLSDSQNLYAHCSTRLFSIERQCAAPHETLGSPTLRIALNPVQDGARHVSLIATEPLTTDEAWVALPLGEVVVFQHGQRLFKPLTPTGD